MADDVYEVKKIREHWKYLMSGAVEVLYDNLHKYGWDDMSIHALETRIRNEVDEFYREYIRWDDKCGYLTFQPERLKKMRKEIVDIANFCMFIYKAINDELKEPTANIKPKEKHD